MSGETPVEQRRQIVADFRAGRYRRLCNCDIATEGFDVPTVSLIAMARPLKNKSLYLQCVGRGTRVLPSTVDVFQGPELAQARRQAIEKSAKTDLVVMDFVGNSGRHELVSLEDALGGDYSKQERKRAKELAEEAEEASDPDELLDKARSELRELARAVQRSKVVSRGEWTDPFRVLHIREKYSPAGYGATPATKSQRDFLRSAGVDEDTLKKLTKAQARKLQQTIFTRRKKGLATLPQIRRLAKHGADNPNISFARARAALDYLSSTGWGARTSAQRLKQLTGTKDKT